MSIALDKCHHTDDTDPSKGDLSKEHGREDKELVFSNVNPDVDLGKEELLPENYLPSDKDVIVGRGKKCFNHTGNQELRRIIKSRLDEYSASTCKHDKSYILSSTIAEIRTAGGFIKQNPNTGRWYDVGDVAAKEKISQTFRDALHEKYKSSTSSKRKRRQEKRATKGNTYQSGTSAHQPMGLLDFTFDMDGIYKKHKKIQNSSLSHSMSSLDLEFDGPVDVIERLSFSLPNINFEDENPLEPIPISQATTTEDDLNVDPPASSDTENVGKPSYQDTQSDPFDLLTERGSRCFESGDIFNAEGEDCIKHGCFPDESGDGQSIGSSSLAITRAAKTA